MDSSILANYQRFTTTVLTSIDAVINENDSQAAIKQDLFDDEFTILLQNDLDICELMLLTDYLKYLRRT